MEGIEGRCETRPNLDDLPEALGFRRIECCSLDVLPNQPLPLWAVGQEPRDARVGDSA